MKLTDNKLLYLKYFIISFIFLLINTESVQSLNAPYYGKLIGKLSEFHHGVSGEVYAVDGRTLHIKDFTYDGQGPAAYFYVGNSKAPSGAGTRVADDRGSLGVLRRYRKESITLTLPEGKTLNNIKWFSVWCDEYSVNFGDVKIPRNFDYPKPQKIDALNGVHGISSDNIVLVDAQTLLIPNLSYDGEAPDAKFWVGRGSKPSPQGIRVPDENGKELPLRRYDRKTVVLTLPHDLTVFDIGHFGIWCEAFTVDFGHVKIPNNLNVPPSLKMLGISPQKRARAIASLLTPQQNLHHVSDTSYQQQSSPLLHHQPPPSTSNYRAQQITTILEATTYKPQLSFRPRYHQTSIGVPSAPSAPSAVDKTHYEFQRSISLPASTHFDRELAYTSARHSSPSQYVPLAYTNQDIAYHLQRRADSHYQLQQQQQQPFLQRSYNRFDLHHNQPAIFNQYG